MKKLFAKFSGAGKKKKWIAAAIVLAVLAGGVLIYGRLGGAKDAAAVEYAPAAVIRDDISVTISGSGTVEPVSRYDIISLVRGEILSAPFNEGDAVNEGDVLYQVDATSERNNIQKQRNNIERIQLAARTNTENLANLKVTAPASGTLTEFSLKTGDTARAEKIATIVDSDSLVATVPFNASQLALISVGDSATVTSALYMTTLDGTVTYKSNAAAGSSDGSTLYNVEITLRNPGSLTGGTSVGATVHTSSGDVKSPVSGKIDNSDTASVIPKVSGKITRVYAKNGQYVQKGELLFQIDDTDYLDAQRKTNLELQDAMLSLESSDKELEKYSITSPISGTVISKTYKAGDTIGSSNGQDSGSVLMVVADTAQMVFNLDVDELEISKVQVGLASEITADALPGEVFTGTVTKVAKEGVSQNGVTTYKVELTIAEPGNLISGMNVNAEIIVEQSLGALLVPISAVSGLRNNEGFVLMKADGGTPPPDGENGGAEGRQGRGRQGGAEGQTGQDGGTPPAGASANGGGMGGGAASFGVPEGYRRVRVTTGLFNA
ncbi:MAG: efflux RND transporter periplasmic adaptor subunit, partial [Clostridiales bacterium]|nr:efflux RND transporter periplasmic adaptor subunit [Clostridiales bacterium]